MTAVTNPWSCELTPASFCVNLQVAEDAEMFILQGQKTVAWSSQLAALSLHWKGRSPIKFQNTGWMNVQYAQQELAALNADFARLARAAGYNCVWLEGKVTQGWAFFLVWLQERSSVQDDACHQCNRLESGVAMEKVNDCKSRQVMLVCRARTMPALL